MKGLNALKILKEKWSSKNSDLDCVLHAQKYHKSKSQDCQGQIKLNHQWFEAWGFFWFGVFCWGLFVGCFGV